MKNLIVIAFMFLFIGNSYGQGVYSTKSVNGIFADVNGNIPFIDTLSIVHKLYSLPETITGVKTFSNSTIFASKVGIGSLNTPTGVLDIVDTTGAKIYFTRYGGQPVINMQRVGGTFSSPTALVNGQSSVFNFQGYNGTGFNQNAQIQSLPEAQTSTNGGASLVFLNTQKGTLTQRSGLLLTGDPLNAHAVSVTDNYNDPTARLSVFQSNNFPTVDLFSAVTAGGGDIFRVKSTGGIVITGISSTAASALVSPADGTIIYVTSTNATFTSIGFWKREAGVWVRSGNSSLVDTVSATKNGVLLAGYKTNSGDTLATLAQARSLSGGGSGSYIPPPSMTIAQRDAIGSPTLGQQIFQTDDSWYEYYDITWGWTPVSLTNETKKYWYEYWNDFGTTSLVQDGVLYLFTNGTGAGGGANMSGTLGTFLQNRNGFMTISTGTTATGYVSIRAESNNLGVFERIGGGKTRLQTSILVPTLSDGTDTYQIIFGLGSSGSGTTVNPTGGVYFLYDQAGVSTGSTASANWQTVTDSVSTRLFTTTSSAVAASSFMNLKIIINATGTSVDFIVNDVLVATHISKIPLTTVNLQPLLLMIKSAGTSARTMAVDYIGMKKKFTTAR